MVHRQCRHTRGIPKVSGLIYKETQYSTIDQLTFLRNLRELQGAYSVISAAFIFQESRKAATWIFSAFYTPAHTSAVLRCLKIVCHASILSAMETTQQTQARGCYIWLIWWMEK